jgi:glyceraldehyde-3-phosphate dehydrogenase (NADP+)
MPWEKVTLTPLPEPGKPAHLRALVDDACEKGARVIGGGGDAHGTFFRPAVLYPVHSSARLYHEEQFGPVVPVTTFGELAEIDHFMRESPYGQQISLFGRDPRELAALVDALVNSVCRINLNTQCRRGPDSFPFTGRKDSAEGTLSVSDALRAFSIRSVVATTATAANQELVGEIVTRRLSSFLSTDFLF